MALSTQYGTGSIVATSTSNDITLSSNISDLSKAFLILYSTGANDCNYQVTGYLWDDAGTTKIKIERYGSALEALVGYFVVECTSDEFDVQRGGYTFGTTDVSQTIDFGTAVDTTRSFIIVNSRANIAASGGDSDGGYFTGEFTNVVSDSTDDLILKRDSANGDAAYARYEVVQWSTASGVTVQSKEKTITGDASSGLTDTIDTEVTTTRTWLYSTIRHNDRGLEQTSIRTVLTNGTTITFDRYDATNSYQSYCRWWAIEFPADGVTVEHLTDTAASGDTTEDTPCTAVTLANSFVWATNNCNGTGQAHPRDRWHWQFTSTTNVRATRAYTGQASQFGVQIIDASGWVISTDVDVDATLDQLTLTEYGGGINKKVSFAAGLDTLVMTEYNPVVKKDISFIAGIDTLALTEHNPDVKKDITLTEGIDALVMAEYSPTINKEVSFTAALDAIFLTEYSPTVEVGAGVPIDVDVTLDELLLTEHTPAVSLFMAVNATLDDLVLTEHNPDVAMGGSVAAVFIDTNGVLHLNLDLVLCGKPYKKINNMIMRF